MRKLKLNKRVIITQVLAVTVFLAVIFIIGSSATSQEPNVDGSIGSWDNALTLQFKPSKYQKLKKVVWQKVSNNMKRYRIPGEGWLVAYNEQAVTFVVDINGGWIIYEDKRTKRRRK